MTTKRALFVVLLVLIVIAVFSLLRTPAPTPLDPPTVPDAPEETSGEIPGAAVPVPGMPPIDEHGPEAVQPLPLPMDSEVSSPPWEGRELTFNEWLQIPPPSEADARGAWLERGVELAAQRRTQMTTWIEEDPRQALDVAVTPRQFERLPGEIQVLVERPVTGEGFYGVLAVCHHGEGEAHTQACEIHHEVVMNFGTFDAEAFKASIYGDRENRMTEENASIFGIAIDGRIALSADDVVIVDEGPVFGEERYGIYHKGLAGTAPDRNTALEIALELGE